MPMAPARAHRYTGYPPVEKKALRALLACSLGADFSHRCIEALAS